MTLADTYEYNAEIEYTIQGQFGKDIGCSVAILSGDQKLGEYKRNMPVLGNTFCAFRSPYNDQAYALYSSDYTATRIMELPKCLDIGGEEPDFDGFCPVDYLVPWDEVSQRYYPFGFVAGYEIGDELSVKVQFLDLSLIHEGKLTRDERFGYLELPAGMLLDEAIEVFGETVAITINVAFDLATGNVL